MPYLKQKKKARRERKHIRKNSFEYIFCTWYLYARKPLLVCVT